MIFQRLHIHNLFSYRGTCSFDLAPPAESDGRNIVLIWGRNGYGKTSFINSLKLALAGVSDDLRASVHAGRNFKRDHFLLGMGDEWMGVFNRQARANGERTFGVKLEWAEPEGLVTLQREWTLEGKSVSERLEVMPRLAKPSLDMDSPLEGESRAFIQARLPTACCRFSSTTLNVCSSWPRRTGKGKCSRWNNCWIWPTLMSSESIWAKLGTWRRESSDASKIRSMHNAMACKPWRPNRWACSKKYLVLKMNWSV